jgi:diaminopimelate epimerase
MEFTKLQATGNDFTLVDARGFERDWPSLARSICDRRFGVGSDGLILMLPSEVADLRMRMFNPDGSEAEACGNGLRCFARYATEMAIVSGRELRIETLGGVRDVSFLEDGTVQVSMGAPVFARARIPMVVDGTETNAGEPVVDFPLAIDGEEILVDCVSMGNPHAVCFLNEPVEEFRLSEFGPRVERHHVFPNMANFEVVNALQQGHLRVRVWERGAGETMSCGSGACAVAVASIRKGLSTSPVDIKLPGGVLSVSWNGEGEVFLSGPAEIVFTGDWRG